MADYWLKDVDVTWINYEKVKELWDGISPLYNKLKHFMISLIVQNYGTKVLEDGKFIPPHILGK